MYTNGRPSRSATNAPWAIAPVATPAIASAFSYFSLIEGELKPGSKVVIVEDLVSTGGSSLKAVQAVRNFGCDVAGMVAIFTYGFPVAVEAFKEAKVTLTTLSNYDAVLEEALRTDYIDESEIAVLQEWRKDPANWNPETK